MADSPARVVMVISQNAERVKRITDELRPFADVEVRSYPLFNEAQSALASMVSAGQLPAMIITEHTIAHHPHGPRLIEDIRRMGPRTQQIPVYMILNQGGADKPARIPGVNMLFLPAESGMAKLMRTITKTLTTHEVGG